MPDIVVITRFHYAKDHPDFEWRFKYYKDAVLPRLLAQTDSDFDIAIWCEPHHADLFRSLSPRILTFNATYSKRESNYFIDYTAWANVTGLEKYHTQIGLDSDDLPENNLIAKVREFCQGDQIVHVGFQPVKLDLNTGKKYRMQQYTRRRGSPAFAFYQPDLGENFKFAYHTSHLRMPRIAQIPIVVPEGFILMSIHSLNDSTKIKEIDKEI